MTWRSYALYIAGNGKGQWLMMTPSTNTRAWFMWRFEGSSLINEAYGKAIDISGEYDVLNSRLRSDEKSSKIKQQWDIVYKDEYPADPKKGELNEQFGLYVDRDFYIQTALSSHRYLDLTDNRNMVIKTPNGRKSQIWYFHQPTRTIRTRYNNQSFDIKSAGKTNNM